ncbi:hypothetical protein JY97_08755 [Alkalispirochaeta odontotermitis]|nr:hypothetical protein JY97_08755 [Alkalispirochaeta odontotermitis]CAB1083362.1 hypothetical protein D1AOALGA4SA_10933 [Olavius algarvensis Delta 1 endosymbiont]
MSQRAKDLSKRIESFRDDVITYVDALSGEEWKAKCEWEEWTAGVTARHIGARHFEIFQLAGMIVEGKDLPPLTIDQINEMSDKDSRAHADSTKDEALEALRKNGADLVAFIAGLSDDELDRKGNMPAFGGDATVSQVIEFVIFQSAQEHFDSMKKAVGR